FSRTHGSIELPEIQDKFFVEIGERGRVAQCPRGGGETRYSANITRGHAGGGVQQHDQLRFFRALTRQQQLWIEGNEKQRPDHQDTQRERDAAPPFPPPAQHGQCQQCQRHDGNDARAPRRQINPVHRAASISFSATSGARFELRHRASNSISIPNRAAAAAASCGQSWRGLLVSAKSSSPRRMATAETSPPFRFSNASGRVSLSRGSTFTTAFATTASACLNTYA